MPFQNQMLPYEEWGNLRENHSNNLLRKVQYLHNLTTLKLEFYQNLKVTYFLYFHHRKHSFVPENPAHRKRPGFLNIHQQVYAHKDLPYHC